MACLARLAGRVGSGQKDGEKCGMLTVEDVRQ